MATTLISYFRNGAFFRHRPCRRLGFLDLPAEIRNMIYKLASDHKHSQKPPPVNFLQCSRQIYQEAHVLFWQSKMVVINLVHPVYTDSEILYAPTGRLPSIRCLKIELSQARRPNARLMSPVEKVANLPANVQYLQDIKDLVGRMQDCKDLDRLELRIHTMYRGYVHWTRAARPKLERTLIEAVLEPFRALNGVKTVVITIAPGFQWCQTKRLTKTFQKNLIKDMQPALPKKQTKRATNSRKA